MSWERAVADYRRMAKPRAVEEIGDIYLIRPLGFLLVQFLRRTPLTPTMVSVLAVLAGWRREIAGGAMLAWAKGEAQPVIDEASEGGLKMVGGGGG